jgi:hypothetical protein
LWNLRAKGFQIENEEIRNVEAEVYPYLQKSDDEAGHPLSQRDVDELQLLLSLIDPQGSDGNSFTKVWKVILQDLTVRMWKENNHQRPHFHIKYKKLYDSSYAIDTLERLAGKMPSKYEKPVLKWAAKNRESLRLTWEKLKAGEDVREFISPANTA